MKKRAGNQKGFTLIEVLLAVAIMGLVVLVISMSIIQIFTGTERNSAKIIALTDIEHATAWLNQDLLMAQTILVSDGENEDPLVYGQPADLVAGDILILNWTDYYGGDATAHQSQYYILDSRLMRDYDGQVANIASYISLAGFSIDDSTELELVTVTLTSSPENISERSETKTYRIYRRS